MDNILPALSETISKAETLEELTRPLLVILGKVTGLESTYLTTINIEAGIQRVEYALNTGDMVIPEGLAVPWADTLCKRALEEHKLYTDSVDQCWGDSEAAAALGIKTYLSAPIMSKQGRLLGTVCGASSDRIARAPEAEPLLVLLSALLSHTMERELLVDELQTANAELTKLALTDPLTGLSNRRAVMKEYERLFALAKRENKYLLVAVIDLDNFKEINDTLGHEAGDTLLCNVANHLKDDLRTSDIVGRTGGDEFVVIALASPSGDEDPEQEMQQAAQLLKQRLTEATIGEYEVTNDIAIAYEGASVGVAAVSPGEVSPDEALKIADQQMYKTKQQRKAREQKGDGT